MERVDQLVSGFLRRRYRTSIRQVTAELRRPLLNELEQVACNLCGGDKSVELARRDKYDLAVTSVMCRNCGLMYLSPRPSAKSYHDYYCQGGDKSGVYHVSLSLNEIDPLLQRYFGPDFRMSDEDRTELGKYVREKYLEHFGAEPSQRAVAALVETLETKAKERESAEYDAYANELYRYFQEFVPRGGKVFEMGAAWGKLLVPWRDRHGCQVSGVEPRARTIQAAKERLGIELLQGFPATVNVPEQSMDAVFNIRTINHMIDPLGDLRHAWRWLKPGGIIGIDISDAVREAYYESFQKQVVEIDHPYMFTANSLSALLQKAGFEVIKREIVETRQVLAAAGQQRPPQYKQIRIVGRKSVDPVTVALPDPVAELSDLLRGVFSWIDREEEESHRRKERQRSAKLERSKRSKPDKDARPALLMRAKRRLQKFFSRGTRSTQKARPKEDRSG